MGRCFKAWEGWWGRGEGRGGFGDVLVFFWNYLFGGCWRFGGVFYLLSLVGGLFCGDGMGWDGPGEWELVGESCGLTSEMEDWYLDGRWIDGR